MKHCEQFQFCEGEKGSTLRVNCHDVYVLSAFFLSAIHTLGSGGALFHLCIESHDTGCAI